MSLQTLTGLAFGVKLTNNALGAAGKNALVECGMSPTAAAEAASFFTITHNSITNAITFNYTQTAANIAGKPISGPERFAVGTVAQILGTAAMIPGLPGTPYVILNRERELGMVSPEFNDKKASNGFEALAEGQSL